MDFHHEYSSATRSEIFPTRKKIPTDLAEVYLLDDFLDQRECERLTTLITARLSTPAVAGRNGGTVTDSYHSCDLHEADDPLMRDIEDRICRTIDVDAFYSKSIQGQYRSAGQKIKAHIENLDQNPLAATDSQGQRAYTCMVYLTDVEEGGETDFIKLGFIVKPKRGRALIWNNVDAQGMPNPNTMHRTAPVVRGSQCIITQCFLANSRAMTKGPYHGRPVVAPSSASLKTAGSAGTEAAPAESMAICTTVLNPGPTFAVWLDYHLRCADLVIVFMDNPQKRPLFEAITAGKPVLLLDGANDDTDRTPSGVMSRQNANTQIAINHLLSRGISWLLHIDDDEIFYDAGDRSWRTLTNVGHVTFINHEAVPLKHEPKGTCFSDCTLFKVNGRMEFSAYRNGKSAVRVTPGIVPWGVHAFAGYVGESYHVRFPTILHYPNPTFEAWVTKFTNYGRFSDFFFDNQRWPITLRFMLDSRDQVHAALGNGDWDAARRYFDAQIPDATTCQLLLQTGALRRYHPLAESASPRRR
jgi:hypothetical protein